MDDLAREIRTASSVVAFTGAGVSTASGIPDFRGEGGLWERHDPEQFHVRALEQDPAAFWERFGDLYSVFDTDPEPNAAHEALATLESTGYLDAIVTQNADGLHQAAGSEAVVELHGTLQQAVCRRCHQHESLAAVMTRLEDGQQPPACRDCGGTLEPAATLFGQQPPDHAMHRAHVHAQQSDVFLVAGSSLTVDPAASLPRVADDHGATLAIVNLDQTPLDAIAEYRSFDDVTMALPALAEAVTEE